MDVHLPGMAARERRAEADGHLHSPVRKRLRTRAGPIDDVPRARHGRYRHPPIYVESRRLRDELEPVHPQVRDEGASLHLRLQRAVPDPEGIGREAPHPRGAQDAHPDHLAGRRQSYKIGSTMPIRWDKEKIKSYGSVWIQVCWPDQRELGVVPDIQHRKLSTGRSPKRPRTPSASRSIPRTRSASATAATSRSSNRDFDADFGASHLNTLNSSGQETGRRSRVRIKCIQMTGTIIDDHWR